jgi:RNA recognition motif-containing protein
VSGLPPHTTGQQLIELCAPYGMVESARVVVFTETHTGQLQGFGIVEMGSAEESRKMIGALNGAQLEGRTLRCFSV